MKRKYCIYMLVSHKYHRNYKIGHLHITVFVRAMVLHCCNSEYTDGMANRVDPDQTVPSQFVGAAYCNSPN